VALLELRDVHTYYGAIHALRGVTMSIDEGEIVTLIGSNGAGKSTTLRTISGLLKPRQGEISMAGKRIDGLPPHEIVALGVSQSPEGRRVFARMTVHENLEMGAFSRRDMGRALMAAPKVLLLDEPSMGLAPILVEQIFEIIKTINERGGTVLLVEQNALMALGVANRGYILQTGEIVLADTAAALTTNDAVKAAYLGGS